MAMIGLTGGIGSGKSKAAKHFEAKGIPVVDADRIGHEVIAPGGPGVQPVIDDFGEEILTDGHIDRDKLAAVIFNDDKKRQHLNGIVHPLIERRIAEQCTAHIQGGARHVIIEAALLAESGHRDPMLDKLILVDCPADIRAQRLINDRGMAPEEAQARIASQTPPEKKRPIADWVIENHGTIEELNKQVDTIIGELETQ